MSTSDEATPSKWRGVTAQLIELSKSAASLVPPIGRLRAQRDRLADELDALRAAPPTNPLDAGQQLVDVVGNVRLSAPLGHYYSPIPDLDDIRARSRTIFGTNHSGVDINEARQLATLDVFEPFYEELPYPERGAAKGLRYQYDNGFFSYGDAIAYFCMLRALRPRHVIEIGSGWSSALALDVNEIFLEDKTILTFIEPYPDRLETLMTDADRRRDRLIADPLHCIDPKVFDVLGGGDILFIDSSHVSKVGSDVNQIVLDILPNLQSGVVVHVHDVFYPFEYPESWVLEGRAWNEGYMIGAYLTHNGRARIIWFNSYLADHHRKEVASRLPLWAHDTGSSLWFEIV